MPPVVGMLSRQAIMQVGLAGLKPFAFEYKRANDPSQNGKVSGTNPGPCAVVDLGTTVDIAYSGDYSARDGPLTSSPQPNPEADPAAEGK